MFPARVVVGAGVGPSRPVPSVLSRRCGCRACVSGTRGALVAACVLASMTGSGYAGTGWFSLWLVRVVWRFWTAARRPAMVIVGMRTVPNRSTGCRLRWCGNAAARSRLPGARLGCLGLLDRCAEGCWCGWFWGGVGGPASAGVAAFFLESTVVEGCRLVPIVVGPRLVFSHGWCSRPASWCHWFRWATPQIQDTEFRTS